jgi:hypothetical protein
MKIIVKSLIFRKSLVYLVIIFSVIFSCQPDSLKMTLSNKIPGHGSGALNTSDEEYLKMPIVNFDTLRKYSPWKGKADNKNARAGITMLPNPPIGNQGSEPSCVGWAIGYTAMGILSYPKYDCWNGALRSPNYVYNQIKQPPVQNGGPCSGGAHILDGLQVVTGAGSYFAGDCSWQVMPYVDGDCTSPSQNSPQTTDAAQNKATGFYKMASNKDVTGMKNALDLGYPIIVSVQVWESFEFLTSPGIWSTMNYVWDPSFNHVTCLVGYDDSKQMFRGQNQWGTSWGDGGFYWVPYTMVQNGCFLEADILYGSSSQLASMYISGPDGLCGPSTSYSITNLPGGSTVSWSSSNTSVGTISSSGTLSYVASGSTAITSTVTLCGSTTPQTFTKTVSLGPTLTGTYSINSGTPASLVNESTVSIQAQRNQFIGITFTLNPSNYNSFLWTFGNTSSSGGSFSVGFNAPATGYSYETETVNLTASGPCGTLNYTYSFNVMSLGW